MKFIITETIHNKEKKKRRHRTERRKSNKQGQEIAPVPADELIYEVCLNRREQPHVRPRAANANYWGK